MTRHPPDYLLIISLGILVLLGLVFLSSSSAVVAFEKFNDSYWYVKHQLLAGLIPGLILLLFFSIIDHRRFQSWSAIFLIITLVFLLAVFVPQLSLALGGAKRWIKLGPLAFQPAEIAKLTFILFLTAWLCRYQKRLASFKQGFLPFLIILAVISIPIILQPDIGTLGVFVATAFVLYFVAGGKISHLIFGGALGLGALAVLIKTAPYRLARLTAFLDPSVDPQGISYHLKQALLAVGSGGLFGQGLGHSRQKFMYLPEVTADSIFAVIAEEIGFVFAVLLLAVFCFFFWRAVKISLKSADFSQLLAVGITFWLAFQTIVNISVMLGLAPLTGLPLPFISYGGTAMAVSLAGVGILINISKQTKI